MSKIEFLKRADDHISIANEQISENVSIGEVSSSFLYGAARFNAWVAACEFATSEDMKESKKEIVEYFVSKYKEVLEEHINNHIETYNFK